MAIKEIKGPNGFSQWIMVGLLVVAAFFVGSLVTKVKFLENGGVTAGTAAKAGNAAAPVAKYKSFKDAALTFAKDLKLDQNKFTSCYDNKERQSIVDADTALGTSSGVNGTPAFFINGILIPGALPLDQFKKTIDAELAGTTDPKTTRTQVAIGSSPTRGTSGAPITIIEFSDFQCPFCDQVEPTIEQLLKDYSGKILLAYKHFPLSSLHPHAVEAANVAECANAQGKFWEMHDKLFSTQNDWSGV